MKNSLNPRRAVWLIAALPDDSGTVMVEYGLVLALLSFAFMGGMVAVESATFAALSYVQSELMNYALRNGT